MGEKLYLNIPPLLSSAAKHSDGERYSKLLSGKHRPCKLIDVDFSVLPIFQDCLEINVPIHIEKLAPNSEHHCDKGIFSTKLNLKFKKQMLEESNNNASNICVVNMTIHQIALKLAFVM